MCLSGCPRLAKQDLHEHGRPGAELLEPRIAFHLAKLFHGENAGDGRAHDDDVALGEANVIHLPAQ